MDWQLLVVYAAILGALSIVVRRVQAWFRGASSGCGSCARCPQADTEPARDEALVSLDVSRLRR